MRKIAGLVLPYEVRDEYDVIWSRGTFDQEVGRILPLLYAHDYLVPPMGAVRVVRSDDIGVYVEGYLRDGIRWVDEYTAIMEALGAGRRLDASIRFGDLEWYERDDGVMVATRASLWEVSLVPWAGVPGAYLERLEDRQDEQKREDKPEGLRYRIVQLNLV